MTPQAISEAATCFSCVPDKQAALIYLLARIANVSSPQTISDGAACFTCIQDKQAAILYLLSAILAGGGGGGGATQVFSGDYGGGTPTDTPTADTALAIDTSNQTLWQWWNSGWH